MPFEPSAASSFRTTPSSPAASPLSPGFTLVELLVVIGIIALLISILLPSLNAARHHAASVKNLSNLRQLGLGLEFYRSQWGGFYPRHSSLPNETASHPTSPSPRVRWADAIFPYVPHPEVYLSPLLNEQERQLMNKPFAHTCFPNGTTGPQTLYFGGYGYNFQYLGNARKPDTGSRPYHASAKDIRRPAETVAIADTLGSRNGGPTFGLQEANYTIDPPLQSRDLGSRGSRRVSLDPNQAGNYGYSGGDGSAGTVVPEHRSTPAGRNRGGKVAAVFADGHGELIDPKELDDFNGDGTPDNGYWNGRADVNVR